MNRSHLVSLLALTLVLLVSGCATPGNTPTQPDEAPLIAEESPEDADAVAPSDGVEVLIPSARTCIFSPDELTAAYSPWSNYVSGEAKPDTGSGAGSCEYSHANPALQYVATPFTIWVTGYAYEDVYSAYRIGALDLTGDDIRNRADVTVDRESLFAALCPDPSALFLCENGPTASIIVRDNFQAFVLRDDVAWMIMASGSTASTNPAETGSLLSVAQLAKDRAPL